MDFTKYTEKFRACEIDADFMRRWMPGSILRCAQQIATDQCAEAGMDADFYQRTSTAFLLARQAMEIYEPLPVGVEYTFVTQASGMNRAVYRRSTQVFDPNGKLMAYVDSDWTLVDTDTRRILRHEPEEFKQHTWMTEIDTPALNMRPEKVDEVERCGEGRADYSLCDQNGHLNNTRYIDLFMNTLSREELKQPLKKLCITYHAEVPMGDPFAIDRGLVEGEKWYFVAQRSGRCHAEANLEF